MLAPTWLPFTALLALFSLARCQSAAPSEPAPPAFASTPTLRLSVLHRVSSQSAWQPRGHLELNSGANTAKLIPADDAWTRLDWTVPPAGQEPRYQLAVGRAAGDGSTSNLEDMQGMSSIVLPRCTVGHGQGEGWDEYFTVFVGDDLNAPGFEGFQYETSSTACDKAAGSPDAWVYGGDSAVTVSFGRPTVPEPVRFAAAKEEAPVKVGADGKIVQPEPEKTFLQKYWIYLVAGLVVMLLASGGEEPAK